MEVKGFRPSQVTTWSRVLGHGLGGGLGVGFWCFAFRLLQTLQNDGCTWCEYDVHFLGGSPGMAKDVPD